MKTRRILEPIATWPNKIIRLCLAISTKWKNSWARLLDSRSRLFMIRKRKKPMPSWKRCSKYLNKKLRLSKISLGWKASALNLLITLCRSYSRKMKAHLWASCWNIFRMRHSSPLSRLIPRWSDKPQKRILFSQIQNSLASRIDKTLIIISSHFAMRKLVIIPKLREISIKNFCKIGTQR